MKKINDFLWEIERDESKGMNVSIYMQIMHDRHKV